MPFVTATVISAAAAIGGLALQAKSTIDTKNANEQAAAASQRAEEIRAEQARVNALREQRKIFQDAQRARAQTSATLAAQGASYSSGAEGALDTISGAMGVQSTALSENYSLGQQTFAANADYAAAKGEAATAQGLGDIGRTLFVGSEKIGAIGSTIYNRTK